MNRCSSRSGSSRKRMSSLIFIFFCLTKRSGRPSSVEPGEGALIRYSFAIGLKTCCTSKRSAASSSARTVLGSATELMALASVVEARGGRAVVDRLRLVLQPRQLSLQVVEEHVGDVVGEAALDDDAQGRQVLAVGREGVRRHEPAALPHRA